VSGRRGSDRPGRRSRSAPAPPPRGHGRSPPRRSSAPARPSATRQATCRCWPHTRQRSLAEHHAAWSSFGFRNKFPILLGTGLIFSLLAMPALPDSGYIAKILGASYSILVASPDYVKRRGAPATLSELPLHTCLRHESPNASAYEWHIQGQTGTYLFNVPNSPFQANMSEALRYAIRAGRGSDRWRSTLSLTI
jgi:LysR substrate binding domain